MKRVPAKRAVVDHNDNKIKNLRIVLRRLPARVPRSFPKDEIIVISDDDEDVRAPVLVPFPAFVPAPVPSTSAGLQPNAVKPTNPSDNALIPIKKQFECSLCTRSVSVQADGIILRNCLHAFCKNCIKLSIERFFSHGKIGVQVKCPHYKDNLVGSCFAYLQDIEIEFALSERAYKWYRRSINQPQKNDLYKELLELEMREGLIKSMEPFDCDICINCIEFNEGIILRNCLHRFCKECIQQTIMHSENVEIKCPFDDGKSTCDGQLEDREIRSALTEEEYERYLKRGLRLAQSTIKGSVLCNAVDCDGWCICEDQINKFTCPKCSKKNCIPCKAIHPGRNCKEYQDDLADGDADGLNSNNRRTNECLQDIIEKGLGMKCPKCQILIMKREGCDWLMCAMCRTEICWATKGPRWGPAGRGDTTGGCGCQLTMKGARCHPLCRFCH